MTMSAVSEVLKVADADETPGPPIRMSEKFSDHDDYIAFVRRIRPLWDDVKVEKSFKDFNDRCVARENISETLEARVEEVEDAGKRCTVSGRTHGRA
jgi:hypothetical protein